MFGVMYMQDAMPSPSALMKVAKYPSEESSAAPYVFVLIKCVLLPVLCLSDES